ncbi:MAG: hypothetical protein VKP57_09210 [Candidatus Sericytochromatia bacterium]|nr:hypothetical protein [Candidatus Sericytochromatia bacterium]
MSAPIDLALDRMVGGASRSRPWQVRIHPEVFRTLEDPDRRFLARRVSVVLGHLALRGTSPSTKTTQGVNEGWLRTGLQGTGGSHFYLWWAVGGTKALRHLDLPARTLLVRAIRHHDDHASLDADDPGAWLPLELDAEGTVPGLESPWTSAQLEFVRSDEPVRLMLGQAGGGKTQALWQAMATRDGEKVLLVTWSGPLADETRLQLGGAPDAPGFLTAGTSLDVLPYRQLLARLLGRDVPHRSLSTLRRAFLGKMAAHRWSRSQWPEWHDRQEALFAELRAHRAGSVPDAYWNTSIADVTTRWVKDRTAELGHEAAQEAGRAWHRLGLDDVRERDALFPELAAAHEALGLLLDPDFVVPADLAGLDRLVLDEVQDLTQVELAVLVELARRSGASRGSWPFLLVAGDEGQSVRPSGFSFNWFKGLLGKRYRQGRRYDATANLRSPAGIVQVLDRATDLYGRFIEKGLRPGKSQRLEAQSVTEARLLHLRAEPDDARQLVQALRGRSGVAIVVLGDELPSWLTPEDAEGLVRTPEDIKGLEFDKVVLVEPGRELERLADAFGKTGVQAQARVAIDRLRVALSRSTGLLAFVDTGAPSQADMASALMFGEDRNQWRLASPEVFALALADDEDADALGRIEQLLRQGLRDIDEQPGASDRAFVSALETLLVLVDSREWDGHRQQEVLDQAIRLGVLLLAQGQQAGGASVRHAFWQLLGPMGREDLTPVIKALMEEGALSSVDARGCARLFKALSGLPRARWTTGLDRVLADHAHGLLDRLREAAAAHELAAFVVHWQDHAVEALGLPDGAGILAQLQERGVETLVGMGDWAMAERLLDAMREPPDLWVVRIAARRGDWRTARDALVRTGRFEEAAIVCRQAGEPGEAIALLEAAALPVPETLRGVATLGDWLTKEAGGLLAEERVMLRALLGEEALALRERERLLGGIAEVRDSYLKGLERNAAEWEKARRLQAKVGHERKETEARRAHLDRLIEELEADRKRLEERRLALGQGPAAGSPDGRQQLAEAEAELFAALGRETTQRAELERLAARLAEREDSLARTRQELDELGLLLSDVRAQARVQQAALEERLQEAAARVTRVPEPVPVPAPGPPVASGPGGEPPGANAGLERRIPAVAHAAPPAMVQVVMPSQWLKTRLGAGLGPSLAEAARHTGFDAHDLLERLDVARLDGRIKALPRTEGPLSEEQARVLGRILDERWKPLAALVGQRPLQPLPLDDVVRRLGGSRRLQDILSALMLAEKRAMPVVQRVLGKTPKSGRDLSVEDCVLVVAALTGHLEADARTALRKAWSRT